MEAIIDIEGDGLKPTKIYCMSTYTKKYGMKTFTDYEEMIWFLKKVTVFIGHNIKRFDIPWIEKLLDFKLECKFVDTLALSWYLNPLRIRHGLATYGEDFGVPKPVIEDWFNLDIEEYIHRCEEDVKINTHLWNSQYSKLKKIYQSEDKIWTFIDYLTFKMHCAHLAEKSRWKLDIEYASNALTKLEQEQEDKIKILTDVMPSVIKYVMKIPPAKIIKKDLSLTVKGQEWFDLLSEHGLPIDTKEVSVVHSQEPPNPTSPHQIKEWLFSLGWKPRLFEYPKGKDPVPQVNQKHGKGICPSVKELYEKVPELETLDGLSVLSHRIPILRGLLKTQEDGYVKAEIQGLTNTLRFKHSHPCVNLPKPDRPYAEAIRSSLIADEGYELCGADMASLEDRLKQHYIFPLDPGYVKSMMQEGYDPHLRVAVTAGMLTQEEADAYKAGDKSKSRVRDMAKNGGYAMQYGAWPPKLVKTLGITLDQAKTLFDGYWKLNWAIKEVSKKQKRKEVDGQMWLLNPVSGFWYSLRDEKDIFSTLIQGTASFVFDLWVRFVLKDREQLTAQFHDEIVLHVKKGFREQAKELLNNAINKANVVLKLNRELGIGIQFSSKYSEIH